ncbi:DNA repair protein RecN [Rathayibacter soli]|uniref:DNA repair protein RecN n=1 Tax=Rathayibacter soli TaxID=3144168 RepID=UPI0027E4D35D|nr:DNA repair protein RecN [Glaciibacter superstes]
MIDEISIRNLGVIADAVLPLGAGFTALTGETGAGKTMVVSALGLLLGERADTGSVRQGSAQTWVEGRWRVADSGDVAERVRDAGGDLDEADSAGLAELVLSRSVSSEGRSRAIIGGRSAPVSVLGELAEKLVVVHGQSDQVRLKSARAQRDALDRFAGAAFGAQLAAYQETFGQWRVDREELEELVADRDRRQAEAAELRAAMAEIEVADPQPGEDDELSERAERLTNLEELREAAATAREQMSAEDSDQPDAVSLIESSRRALERAADHDAALAPIAALLADAGYLVTDIAAQLSSYLATLDTDGARELEVVQERRAQLSVLLRKYGPTLADVIERLDNGSARLFELDGDSERIEQLTLAVDVELDRLTELAGELSAARIAAGKQLGAAVSAELGALAMPDARLSVEVTQRDEFTHSGRDHVAILLQPHAGAEPRALSRGASGGELSRVMLALEVVLAGSDPVPTFVFDEIDAGVGGAAAIEIGRRLGKLAGSAQVIVVTHLAQVAAFATNHLSVVKDSDGAVTASSVRQLSGEERIAEMTRLLSGLSDSASGLEHARELLELAGTRNP